jgi:hypothetical protein
VFLLVRIGEQVESLGWPLEVLLLESIDIGAWGTHDEFQVVCVVLVGSFNCPLDILKLLSCILEREVISPQHHHVGLGFLVASDVDCYVCKLDSLFLGVKVL